MGVSLADFMKSLAFTQGEATAGGELVRDASTKLATRIADAASAAYRTGQAGEIASTAGTVASGGRVLGFFGRIGSVGGFLSGTAATVAGVGATVLVLGTAAWYLGGALGDKAGDEPTAQYGDAINHLGDNLPPAGPTDAAVEDEPYAVWLLTNVANGSVFVGQESAIKGTFTCNWGGGGLCASAGGADIPTEYTKLSQDYFGREGAQTDACASMTSEPVYIWIAGGSKADIYGGNYWVDWIIPC